MSNQFSYPWCIVRFSFSRHQRMFDQFQFLFDWYVELIPRILFFSMPKSPYSPHRFDSNSNHAFVWNLRRQLVVTEVCWKHEMKTKPISKWIYVYLGRCSFTSVISLNSLDRVYWSSSVVLPRWSVEPAGLPPNGGVLSLGLMNKWKWIWREFSNYLACWPPGVFAVGCGRFVFVILSKPSLLTRWSFDAVPMEKLCPSSSPAVPPALPGPWLTPDP